MCNVGADVVEPDGGREERAGVEEQEEVDSGVCVGGSH